MELFPDETFDWDDAFEEFGLYVLNDPKELESVCRDDRFSPYIWCSAMVKKEDLYHLVTYDFFE